jgi:hypothetical protein
MCQARSGREIRHTLLTLRSMLDATAHAGVDAVPCWYHRYTRRHNEKNCQYYIQQPDEAAACKAAVAAAVSAVSPTEKAAQRAETLRLENEVYAAVSSARTNGNASASAIANANANANAHASQRPKGDGPPLYPNAEDEKRAVTPSSSSSSVASSSSAATSADEKKRKASVVTDATTGTDAAGAGGEQKRSKLMNKALIS